MSQALANAALITGAARGIGLATARRFLADGWRVVLLDIDKATLDRTYDALREENGAEAVIAICCDVADAAGVTCAVSSVGQKFGRLDALVNNAGIAIFKPILDVTYEDWSRVLAVNLTGPFLCTQAAVPLMRDSGGGAIVNITSISGLRASTLRTAYGTSKAGLAHLTQQQAVELASLGIRVNAVAPGPVDTAMAKAVHTPEIRPPITTPFRSTDTDWSRSWPKRSTSCAVIAQATSPDRPLRWTAALRLPALAYRTCATVGGTISGHDAQAAARALSPRASEAITSSVVCTSPNRP